MAETTPNPTPQQKSLVLAPQKLSLNPNASKYLITRTKEGWQPQEMATIGESDLFVLRTKEGALQAFSKPVRLYESKKEIYKVQGNWAVSSTGYTHCNQYAGLHLITPSTIVFQGRDVTNPYMVYDEITRELRMVICRKMALGYSLLGNLVATDAVVYYNFDVYFLEDLQAKAKKFHDAVQFGSQLVCPFVPDEEVDMTKAEPFVKTKDHKVFVFKRITSGEGLWINLAHPEAFDVYQEHIQLQKFGDRKVQRIAERNALKIHPAIATTNLLVDDNGVGVVTVFGFRSMLTEEEIGKIGEQIARGERINDVIVETSEAVAGIEDVKGEEVEEGEEVKGAVSEAEHKEQPAKESVSVAAPASVTPPPTQVPPASVATSSPEKKNYRQMAEEEAKKKGLSADDMGFQLFKKHIDALDETEMTTLYGVLAGTTPGKKQN